MDLFDFLDKSPLQSRIYAALKECSNMDGAIKVELLGSAMYLPNPNDIDVGVLVNNFPLFMKDRMEQGWESTGDYSMAGADWGSVRKGEINLIVMADPGRFERFHYAMQVCEYLNLAEKKDRIAVCQIVRDQVDAWQVNITAETGD